MAQSKMIVFATLFVFIACAPSEDAKLRIDSSERNGSPNGSQAKKLPQIKVDNRGALVSKASKEPSSLCVDVGQLWKNLNTENDKNQTVIAFSSNLNFSQDSTHKIGTSINKDEQTALIRDIIFDSSKFNFQITADRINKIFNISQVECKSLSFEYEQDSKLVQENFQIIKHSGDHLELRSNTSLPTNSSVILKASPHSIVITRLETLKVKKTCPIERLRDTSVPLSSSTAFVWGTSLSKKFFFGANFIDALKISDESSKLKSSNKESSKDTLVPHDIAYFQGLYSDVKKLMAKGAKSTCF